MDVPSRRLRLSARTTTRNCVAGQWNTITYSDRYSDSDWNTFAHTYGYTMQRTPCSSFSENFDGVTAPALPAGWVAANAAGAAPLWVTSTTTPDTAPNDAFIDDPATVSDKRLDTPNIAITSAAAQVSFRNNYQLESTFDGGVLEVSSPNINGGAFTDITNAAVGGSFVTGGYNATISTAFMSPIAGRMAWSGSSAGGYINTRGEPGTERERTDDQAALPDGVGQQRGGDGMAR